MDPEKLDDDQKRTLKTLPTLEAIQKELGEVKKAVEVRTTLFATFKPDHTIPNRCTSLNSPKNSFSGDLSSKKQRKQK